MKKIFPKLEKYRCQIDKIDKKIIELLARRYGVVKKISCIKKELKLPALDRKRWQQVLKNRIELAKDLGLERKLIIEIYEIIHQYSLKIEENNIKKSNKQILIFGIQGGRGSFNEQAVLTYIKNKNIKNFKIKYLYTTKNVLRAVNKGEIDFGLFAIVNSRGGIVEESINVLENYNFKIIDKITIFISHFLMKRSDVEFLKIKQIMAHPQVFAQCQNTLKIKYPNLKLKSGVGNMIDTATSAKALANGKIDKNTAILGPKILSEIYNFDIIDENLQDDKNNQTTFLLVNR
ncbi:MAG: hypothetical protein Fur009_1350 [Candidatus Microgenomates bacterium]